MSRHLIADAPGAHPDAVISVGWDLEARTYFCDIVRPGWILHPVVGDDTERVLDADVLAGLVAFRLGLNVPAVLVARLRLEKLAVSSANAPFLDWRSGEPLPVREG